MPLVFDVETSGLIPELGQIAHCGALYDTATKAAQVYRFSNRHDAAEFIERLANAPELIAHNAAFDMRQVIRTFGLPHDFFAAKHIIDTLVWAKILIPGRDKYTGGYGLKILTRFYEARALKHENPKKWLRKHAPKERRHDYSLLPDEILIPYVANDVIRTALLYEQLKQIRYDDRLQRCLDVDEAMLHLVLKMELKGVAMSVPHLDAARKAMAHQLAKVHEAIPFDWRSRTALIENYGAYLAEGKFLTKKGAPRADKEALLYLEKRGAPFATEIRQARHYEKYLSTYLKAWEAFKELGRIHATFHVAGTLTGRLSSSDPNLQNVPKELRRVIIPEPGHVFLVIDYAQMEMKAAAYLSGDDALHAACEGDVHYETAKALFKTEEPTAPQRKITKTFNFAVLYGARAGKIRHTLVTKTSSNWSLRDAQALFEAFWSRYPKFAVWSAAKQRLAQSGGTDVDPFGRRQKASFYRPYSITNYLIQGFCAGIAKRAMLALDAAGFDARLMVHDEIVCQTPNDSTLPERLNTMSRLMSEVEGFKFPVTAKVAHTSWAEGISDEDLEEVYGEN